MGKYTKEDIFRMVNEDDIKFIRMQFTDIFGQLKNVAITASQIEKAVNNQIAIDGSSIEGFVRIQESDQYLYPDLESFAILPWRPQYGKVARLICDVHNPDGTPFVGDPRYVLKKVAQRGRPTWATRSTSGRNANFSSSRQTIPATLSQKQTTRPVISISVRSIAARVHGAKSYSARGNGLRDRGVAP